MEMILAGVINLFCFFINFKLGSRVFFQGGNFLSGLFLFVFSILFCLVPAVCNFVIGNSMEHPEAVLGVIRDESIYMKYSISILLYTICLFFCSVFFLKVSSLRNVKLEVEHGFALRSLYITACIFVSGAVLCVYSLGFSAANPYSLVLAVLDAGRMAQFSNSNYSSFGVNLSFYLMSSIGIYSYLDFKLKYQNKLISLIVYFCLFLVFVMMGGRQFVMITLSAIFFALYSEGKLKKSKLAFFALFSGLFLAVWQYFRAFIFSGGASEYDFSRMLDVVLRGDLSYFYYASLEAIRYCDEFDFNVPFATYRNLMFFFLPADWLFGIKVPDLSSLFSIAFDSGILTRDGNYPPGFVGMFFINFGFSGFFLLGLPVFIFFIIFDRLNYSSFFYVPFCIAHLFLVLQLSRGTLLGVYQCIFMTIIFALLVFVNFLFSKNRLDRFRGV